MNTRDPVTLSGPSQRDNSLPAIVIRKVTWRLAPILCVLYILNILDRTNAGFARLTMQDDLNMSRGVFDIGFGIFYIGYLVFEVPSNLLLRKVGARKWIARIMITWGLISCATLAVTGPWSFYTIRILLGVAEAGFFPGIVLYLSFWFPARERAKVMALFMTGTAIAGVVGNPISGTIMQYCNGLGGLKGWQWLFLLEGIPSVLMGFVVLWYLTDSPEQATWLTPEERDWLVEQMNQEDRSLRQRHGVDLLRAMTDPRVWLLICVYLTVAIGANAAGSYFPELLNRRFEGLNKVQIGFLSALPSVCAVLGMTFLGAHSDRTGERRKHLAFAALMAAIGWLVSVYAPSPWLFLAGLCLAQAGMISMLPIFWTLPTAFLTGVAAAGGIALINSVANLGGFVGPWILGQFGPMTMAVTLFVGAILALMVRHDSTLDRGFPGGSSTPSSPGSEGPTGILLKDQGVREGSPHSLQPRGSDPDRV